MVSSSFVAGTDEQNKKLYYAERFDKSMVFNNNVNERNIINFSQCSHTESTTIVCSDYGCNEDHCCDPNVKVYHPNINTNNFQYCNEHHNDDNIINELNKCCEIQKWLDSIISEVRLEIAAEKCECSNAQTCTHERVSLSNFTKEEIMERKRYQNRKAAAKYRLKKKVNLQMDKFEMDLLCKKNKLLKDEISNLESEIERLQCFLSDDLNFSFINLFTKK
uniref:BZIP domain-containing protein n=1 Tax=Parastrongyloides trichosuri TaxID=131310 RepID=A0A0N4ZRC6_PARTI